MHIEWIKKPVLELINDDQYETFRCSHYGCVMLHGRVGLPRKLEFHLGWRTDITSVPRPLRWLIPQIGPHAPAAILHDRLLDEGVPRRMARRWARIQLDQLKDRVSRFRRMAIMAGIWFWDTFMAEEGQKMFGPKPKRKFA